MKVRKQSNLTENSKEWLVKIFEEGQKSGIKASAEAVSGRMRSERFKETGELRFKPEEFLSVQQIKSQFAILNSKNRNVSSKDNDTENFFRMLLKKFWSTLAFPIQ